MSLKWYAPGQHVGLFSSKVRGGMIYTVAGRLPWPGEPSAIDLGAKVGLIPANASDDLGYWPSYGEMTPAQRKSYLNWLAAGRRDADPQSRSLGYLFTFFYGLERRIIVDKDRDSRLLDELVSLLKFYGPAHASRSLRGYFLSLLYFGGWQQGPRYFRNFWPHLMQLDEGSTSLESTKLILANLYQLGERMDWSIAYRIALSDPNSRRSSVIKKSRNEFWTLFRTRYDSQFPGGMELKAAKQDAVFSHHPGSQAIGSMRQSGRNDICSLRVPNVSGIHSQFKPLSGIWNSCIEDLSGFEVDPGNRASG